MIRTLGMVMIMIGFSISFGYMMAILRVPAIATQFFIDTDGRIRQIVNGPLTEERAIAIVESLLPPGASPTATEATPPTAPPTS